MFSLLSPPGSDVPWSDVQSITNLFKLQTKSNISFGDCEMRIMNYNELQFCFAQHNSEFWPAVANLMEQPMSTIARKIWNKVSEKQIESASTILAANESVTSVIVGVWLRWTWIIRRASSLSTDIELLMAVSVLSILENNLSASAVVTGNVTRIMRANWMSENITVVCSRVSSAVPGPSC